MLRALPGRGGSRSSSCPVERPYRFLRASTVNRHLFSEPSTAYRTTQPQPHRHPPPHLLRHRPFIWQSGYYCKSDRCHLALASRVRGCDRAKSQGGISLGTGESKMVQYQEKEGRETEHNKKALSHIPIHTHSIPCKTPTQPNASHANSAKK